jgi:hypothetical protein
MPSIVKERPYVSELARLRSARRNFVIAWALILVGVPALLAFGLLIASLGGGSSYMPPLLAFVSLGAGRVLVIYALYSRCPMCGNFFFVQPTARRFGLDYISRILDPAATCMHCGFQFSE